MRPLLISFLSTVLILSANAQLIGSREKSFTQNKLAEYEYRQIALSQVQFYISSEINLKRELPKEVLMDGAKVNGTVAFENGKQYVYYVQKKGSFCVFESLSSDKKKITMRFGQDQDETMVFTLKKGVGSDQNSYFVLEAPDKKISFLGYTWDLLSWEGVRLEVKEKNNTRVKVDKTKSKGMKIDGTEKKGLLKKKN